MSLAVQNVAVDAPLPAVVTVQDLAGSRIIVLDDNAFDRERVARFLKNAGITVETQSVGTLAEFQHELAKSEFDFALVDFNLGDGTGFDALDILQSEPTARYTVPILISGNVTPEITVQAMKDGYSDVLSKENLSVEALRGVLQDALQDMATSSQAESELQAQVQVLMGVINEVAIKEMRPKLAKMLRLIRQLSNRVDPEQNALDIRALDRSCYELHEYCQMFSKDVQTKARTLQ